MNDINTGLFVNNEATYQTLVEQLPLPVALYTGQEMRVSSVNDALLRVWGKNKSIIGKTFKEALPELEGQGYYELLDQVYASGDTYEAKEALAKLDIDGNLQNFYFNFTYKPLKGADGKVWGILNTAFDVTELVTTKHQLANVQDDAEFALDATSTGTWLLDPQTDRIFWDKRCQALFGYKIEEPIDLSGFLQLIDEADRAKVALAIANAVDPAIRAPYEVKFKINDAGDERWLHCKGRAYFDGNRAVRFGGTAHDVSPDVFSQKEYAKFRTLVEKSADLIGVTDLEGNVLYLNKAGQDLTGLHGEKAYQRPSADYLVEAYLAGKQDEITSAMANKGSWTGELLYKNHITGEEIPCHLNAFFIEDPDTKEPIGMASVTRDLRPEKARMKQEQKLISLVENSADLMSILEPTGFNSYINKAGKELLGFDSDEQVLTTPIADLHRPEDLAFVQAEVLPALATKGRWAGQMMVKHLKTGEIFPVYNSTVRIDNPLTGEMLGAGALMRDMRPELAAQKALADSERLFRDITTAAPTALWMADENLNITFVNQIWINWTGKALDAQLGKGWLDCVADEDRYHASEKFADDFLARRKHESQFRIKNPKGGLNWVICTGNPQYLDDGTFYGYIGACVDITELKELQRQKDDFLGIASHELKTPVTSIKAYAQVLETMFRDSGDAKKADMVRKMDLQVNRLTSLIGDLLDVTKIQTGKLQFNDREFNFNELVGELVEDLQRTTKKHTIIQQFTETGTVFADRERIGQVIANMITNAIKYSPNADKIIVFTRTEGNEVRLCVQDFGIGIAHDKRSKVFEQFYRVSGDKQHTFPGLGLGLYISSEIIKREHGTIWVNSTEGKGSTFCFSLPKAIKEPNE